MPHEKSGTLTISLQVEPGDQEFVHQERQYIITVHTLFGWDVNFDTISEIEQALRPASLPNQRIEWCQQRLAENAAGVFRVPMQESRRSPTFNRDGDQKLRVHQLGDSGSRR